MRGQILVEVQSREGCWGLPWPRLILHPDPAEGPGLVVGQDAEEALGKGWWQAKRSLFRCLSWWDFVLLMIRMDPRWTVRAHYGPYLRRFP